MFFAAISATDFRSPWGPHVWFLSPLLILGFSTSSFLEGVCLVTLSAATHCCYGEPCWRGEVEGRREASSLLTKSQPCRGGVPLVWTFTSVSFCVVRQEGLGRDALPRPGTRLAMLKPQRALWDISQGPLFLHFSHSLRPSPGQPGGVSGDKAQRRGGGASPEGRTPQELGALTQAHTQPPASH